MRALATNVFAGGFTLGVRQHFSVIGHLEESDYGAATVARNMPEIQVRSPVSAWPDAIKAWGGCRGVDLLYGNPPCAAWSQNGRNAVQGLDWRLDARLDCTERHFALFEELKPRVWVTESVPRAFTTGREFFDALTVRALAKGYGVTYLLHNARHLGLGQNRPRFFMVAHREAFEPDPPDFQTVVTCGDVLSKMNYIGPHDMTMPARVEAMLPRVPQGSTLRTVWEGENPGFAADESGRVRGRPPFAWHRTRWDAPSHTVSGMNIVHPLEHRSLTTREMAALCGFPADYEFVGGRDANQIAQGVCPPVAEWLARGVRRSLERGAPLARRVTLWDLSKGPSDPVELPLPGVAPAQVQVRSPAFPHGGGTVRVSDHVVVTVDLVTTGPSPLGKIRPKAGVKSGEFTRVLLMTGRYSVAEIVAIVRENYPGSTAGPSDVAWNKRKLRDMGHAVPETPKGPRLAQPVQAQPTAVPVVPEAPEAASGALEDAATVADQTEHGPPRSVAAHATQPTRSGRVIAHGDYDRTSLRETTHGDKIHRDYAAHWFRWGWSNRHITNEHDVLEVGCGVDTPLFRTFIGAYANRVPKSYLGVDLNALPRAPARPWGRAEGRFNFNERWRELGQFDKLVCFEVIEHMTAPLGLELLAGLRGCMREGAELYLSTPVFDGHAAANHIHEYTVAELQTAIEGSGLQLLKRFGTFASYNALKKVADPRLLELLDGVNEYYSTEVTACFLAPLYPDASRNNVWVLRRAK